jgi:monoamine oxidase
VRVETAHGTLECRTVVVTVPTPLLAQGTPRFTPALPAAYDEAFDGLALGVANKVFVEVTPGAMPLEGTVHLVASDATTRTASVTVRPAGHEVLQVFFGGAYASELEEKGTLEHAAREELMRVFGSDLGRAIRRTTATAWLTDPWARGSYSAARPGFARCRGVLARPIANRIFFAGDAVPAKTYGAIDGAWESGAAAARAVSTALGMRHESRGRQ